MCGGRIYTNHRTWKEVKKDMIYLDNSATTQVDQDVAGTACEVMTEVYGNPSSPYLLGRDAMVFQYGIKPNHILPLGKQPMQNGQDSDLPLLLNLPDFQPGHQGKRPGCQERGEAQGKNYHHCHRTFFCPGILQVTGGRRIRGGIHPSQGREDTGR